MPKTPNAVLIRRSIMQISEAIDELKASASAMERQADSIKRSISGIQEVIGDLFLVEEDVDRMNSESDDFCEYDMPWEAGE